MSPSSTLLDDIDVVPVSPVLGAEIRGIDLSRGLDDRQYERVNQALLDHRVIVFRGQDLSDDALLAFSRRFGTLDKAPPNENGKQFVPGYEEIYVISNVVEDGVAIGALGAGEASWHTDMSFLPDPPLGSVLYSLEVPPAGGDTWFLNTVLAYQSLPVDLRARVDGLSLKHDSTTNSGGFIRYGYEKPTDLATSPGTVHPLVITHPESGDRALYLGRRLNAFVVGLPIEEGEALLDELWSHVAKPEFTWAHSWRKGDLVMWDNRVTMHRRDSFDNQYRRLMHRTQIRARHKA